jgi:hypothetical protein
MLQGASTDNDLLIRIVIHTNTPNTDVAARLWYTVRTRYPTLYNPNPRWTKVVTAAVCFGLDYEVKTVYKDESKEA